MSRQPTTGRSLRMTTIAAVSRKWRYLTGHLVRSGFTKPRRRRRLPGTARPRRMLMLLAGRCRRCGITTLHTALSSLTASFTTVLRPMMPYTASMPEQERRSGSLLQTGLSVLPPHTGTAIFTLVRMTDMCIASTQRQGKRSGGSALRQAKSRNC